MADKELQILELKEAIKLLELCEPYLSSGESQPQHLVYKPPATMLRERADAIEKEEELKHKINVFLGRQK